MRQNIITIILLILVSSMFNFGQQNGITKSEKLIQGRTIATFYHDKLQRTILINGAFDPGPWHTKYIELWQWNNSDWELISNTGPEVRNAFGWAYDHIRGKLVIYGGTVAHESNNRKWFSDTWEWDGKGWTKIETPVKPGIRFWAGMAYDPVRKACVLFGGANEKFDLFNDTWTFNGKEWKQVFTQGPSPRRPATMFYFPPTKKIYVYGGHAQVNFTQKAVIGDTWELGKTGWKELESASVPGKQEDAVVVFNKKENEVWMVGGTNNGAEPKFVGTSWSFDGKKWQSIDIDGLSPRGGHSMSYNLDTKSILLQGGFNIGGGPSLRDTWVLAQNKKEWSCISGCFKEQEQWIANHPTDSDALLTFIAASFYTGKPEKIEALVSKAVQTAGISRNAYRRIANYLAAIKLYKESVFCYEKILEMEPQGTDFYNLACIYAKVNDNDKSFASLSKAIELGFNSKQKFESDTDLGSLRSDSRWKALMEKLK